MFVIELCIVFHSHREIILKIAIPMTEYLPMDRSSKACLLYNLIILPIVSKIIKKDKEFVEENS